MISCTFNGEHARTQYMETFSLLECSSVHSPHTISNTLRVSRTICTKFSRPSQETSPYNRHYGICFSPITPVGGYILCRPILLLNIALTKLHFHRLLHSCICFYFFWVFCVFSPILGSIQRCQVHRIELLIKKEVQVEPSWQWDIWNRTSKMTPGSDFFDHLPCSWSISCVHCQRIFDIVLQPLSQMIVYAVPNPSWVLPQLLGAPTIFVHIGPFPQLGHVEHYSSCAPYIIFSGDHVFGWFAPDAEENWLPLPPYWKVNA